MAVAGVCDIWGGLALGADNELVDFTGGEETPTGTKQPTAAGLRPTLMLVHLLQKAFNKHQVG